VGCWGWSMREAAKQPIDGASISPTLVRSVIWTANGVELSGLWKSGLPSVAA